MQLVQRNWLNTRFLGKYLFQKKYKVNNFFSTPQISYILVSMPILPNTNKHIDIAFWFLSILFEKQDFKYLTKTIKRSLTGDKKELIGLVLYLTGKNIFWKLNKLIYQLLPPQEYRYEYFIRSIKRNIYNFSFTNLTTYSETQTIYNDPKNLLVSDLILNFNFYCSTSNPFKFYTLIKFIKQLPVRLSSKTSTFKPGFYKFKAEPTLWNLKEIKFRERRYFKYKQKRMIKRNNNLLINQKKVL